MSFTLREGESRSELDVAIEFLGKSHKHKVQGGAVGMWRLGLTTGGNTEEIELRGDAPLAELGVGERLVVIRGADEGIAVEVRPTLPTPLTDDEARAELMRFFAERSVVTTTLSSSQSSAHGAARGADADRRRRA